LLSCQQKDDPSTSLEAEVVYLSPSVCCANVEISSGTPIFGELVGYEESILGAVNIDDFLTSDIMAGDHLKIKFTFTEEFLPCNVICNRHNGIPIKLSSLEKIL